MTEAILLNTFSIAKREKPLSSKTKLFRIITLMIIENRALWLARSFASSRYNRAVNQVYFARLRHGIFPCLSENSKAAWVPGMCVVQLAHLGSAKESRRFYLFFIWMKHIMSSPKKKFDLENVKEFIGNVKRKVASNPRLSLAVVFLLFTVILAVSLTLAFKPGQKSSETKGRCG